MTRTIDAVNPKTRFTSRPRALERHPDLPVLMIATVDIWPRIDVQLANFLASLLNAAL